MYIRVCARARASLKIIFSYEDIYTFVNKINSIYYNLY